MSANDTTSQENIDKKAAVKNQLKGGAFVGMVVVIAVSLTSFFGRKK